MPPPDAGRIAALRARLQARARAPRPPEQVPVRIGALPVGQARPEVARFLVQRAERFSLGTEALVFDDTGLDAAGRTETLAGAAAALRAAGLTHAWRDELLEIRAGRDAPPLAAIERAVCRTLGITTLAVHMNAVAADGTLFVARRSPGKKIDPGLWDNLVGGMVPAGESTEAALAREAWEEAGLRPADYSARRGGLIRLERPVPEGWMSEVIQVFDARIAAHARPANQDGEVDAIERREPAQLLAGIEAGDFTLEAALVSLDWLARMDLSAAPGAPPR